MLPALRRLPALLVFGALAHAAFAAQLAPQFPAPLAGGMAPLGTSAVADLDGDGFTDVVTLTTSFTLTLRFGDGVGGFTRAATVPFAGFGPTVAIDDFDDDGRADLLVPDISAIRVLLNLGGGAFTAPVITPVLNFSSVIATGDVDADGHVDIVTTLGSNVRVHRGLGNGTFASPVGSAVGISLADAELGDANGDGALDLWIHGSLVGTDDHVGLALGNGDGTFQVASTMPLPENGFTLRAADVDGDGLADAGVVSHGVSLTTGLVQIFFGRASGPFVAGPSIACTSEPFDLDFADVDLDGDLDLGIAAMDSSVAPGLEILLGDGQGGFTSAGRSFVGVGPRRLRFGKLDPNGSPDAFVTDSAGSVIGVANIGLGHFETLERLAVENEVVRAIAVDAVGSTLPDLVSTVVNGKDELALFENLGGGQFAPATYLPVPGLPRAVASGDLNHDGNTDLVSFVSQTGTNRLVTQLGDGLGGFQTLTGTVSLRGSKDLALADVDRDGELDALLPHYGIFSVSRGLGDGTFAPPTEHTILGGSIALDAVDLNEDGWLDVVSLDDRHNRISFVLGLDGAQFGVPTTIVCSDRPASLAIADFDADGHADVAVSLVDTSWNSRVLVSFGDGHGGFAARVVLPGGVRPSIVAADFSGDGLSDLASCSDADGGMRVHVSQGRTFAAPRSFSIGTHPVELGASDLDADGRVDVFATGGIQRRIVVSRQK